jgi:hypothetical protein
LALRGAFNDRTSDTSLEAQTDEKFVTELAGVARRSKAKVWARDALENFPTRRAALL